MRKAREPMPEKMIEKPTGFLRLALGRGLLRASVIGARFSGGLLVAGCSRAPSFNILGSCLPGSRVFGILGRVLAVVVRLFFVRINLENHLVAPLILVYPC